MASGQQTSGRKHEDQPTGGCCSCRWPPTEEVSSRCQMSMALLVGGPGLSWSRWRPGHRHWWWEGEGCRPTGHCRHRNRTRVWGQSGWALRVWGQSGRALREGKLRRGPWYSRPRPTLTTQCKAGRRSASRMGTPHIGHRSRPHRRCCTACSKGSPPRKSNTQGRPALTTHWPCRFPYQICQGSQSRDPNRPGPLCARIRWPSGCRRIPGQSSPSRSLLAAIRGGSRQNGPP
mmetsp:Transcript_34542/g.99468  ORF Transcript_34542/g.99468 Transcript_34542/m.99468 type:complete len:232 (-) Transcript_34542:1261-1956(-)